MSSRRTPQKQAKRATGYRPRYGEIQRAVRQELMKEIEPKVHYTSGNNLLLATWNGYVVDLNDMSQGTTYTTRIGDRVRMKGVSFRFLAQGANATTLCAIRVMLIHWKDNSTPTGADILETTGSHLALLSPKRWHNRKEFNVLFDSGRLTLWYPNIATGGTPIVVDSGLILKSVKNLVCDYDAGATTCNNRLYLLFFEDSASSANVQFSYYAKATYTDA